MIMQDQPDIVSVICDNLGDLADMYHAATDGKLPAKVRDMVATATSPHVDHAARLSALVYLNRVALLDMLLDDEDSRLRVLLVEITAFAQANKFDLDEQHPSEDSPSERVVRALFAFQAEGC